MTINKHNFIIPSAILIASSNNAKEKPNRGNAIRLFINDGKKSVTLPANFSVGDFVEFMGVPAYAASEISKVYDSGYPDWD